LIVEDSLAFRFFLSETLAKIGFPDITEAVNGKEALTKWDGHQVIITDFNMPIMNGLDMVQAMRRKDLSPRPYIIMLTTKQNITAVLEGLRSGLDNYLLKPFSDEDLAKKVNPGFSRSLFP